MIATEHKFTEGPWKAELYTGTGDDEGACLLDISSVSYDADDDGRLQDYGHSLMEGGALVDESDEVNRANAALMAAAPELLRALEQALVEEAHGVGCKAIARSRPNACDCWLSAVRPLIAEAVRAVRWTR